MTTLEEGYGAKYSKIKTNKQLRSLTPNHYESARDHSPLKTDLHNDPADTQLGKIVSKMGDRIDGIEIKIVNITNIVKLLQKYTETKDIQYEKEKENEEFKKNFNNPISLESQEVQSKINELEVTIHKAKVQITAMESLRISIEREKTNKAISSNSLYETTNRTIQSPTVCTTEMMGEIEEIMEKMEENLRSEMNKKIDICMSYFKSSVQGINKGSSSPTNMSTTMMQEQLHNMTLTMNKVESDCTRNKMIMENKMDQIINYVNSIKRKESLLITEGKESNRSFSKSATRKSKNDPEDNKSERSSISKSRKSKSKSQGKKTLADKKSDESHKNNEITKIEDQKKQKEAELKEVLRKKKENLEKLKIKK